MSNQHLSMLTGAVLVLFGLFCPFAVAPVAGAISGFNVLGGFFVVPLVLVGLAAWGVFNYRYTLIKMCGLGLVGLFVAQSLRMQMIFSQAREQSLNGADLMDAVSGAALTGAGVSWGAGLLLIGGLAVLASGWIVD